MTRRSNLRRLLGAGLIGLAAVAPAGAHESATGDCGHYETVTVTRTVEVPYTAVVTRHDRCGTPYEVTRTAYRTRTVTVRARVFVAD